MHFERGHVRPFLETTDPINEAVGFRVDDGLRNAGRGFNGMDTADIG
jgi:hypothetical protein